MDQINLNIIIIIILLLSYFIFMMEKYGIEISYIIIDEKELDKQNFFHNKIINYKNDSHSTKSTNYIINLCFVVTIIFFILSLKNFSFSIKLITSLFSLYIVHILSYILAISYPVQIFSLFYYPYQLIKIILFPIIIILKSIEKIALKPINISEKYLFLSYEDREKLISKLDNENSILQNDDIDKEDIEMINSIIDLKDTSVKEIMIPRVNINAININASLKDVIQFIDKYKHSRIPIYKNNIDNIIGILYVKDIIKHFNNKSIEWQKLLREPYFIPFSKKIDLLLSEFKIKKLHIAIIVDEFGGTAGLITMEDILEEIVGEIEDEFDFNDKDIKKINNTTYIIDGHTNIYDIEEQTDIRFNLPEDKPYDSISGFIQEFSDTIPNENFTISKNGYKFIIIKKQGPKIEKIKVIKLEGSRS